MTTLKKGNLFDSNCKTLVNTVNCVGVMGKGITLTFKLKFPKMFDEYRKNCLSNKIKIGELYPYYENNLLRVLNFPTKVHWKNKSELICIYKGLE